MPSPAQSPTQPPTQSPTIPMSMQKVGNHY